MNTIPSPEKRDHVKERVLSEEIQESIHPYEPEINIADGGEFLDDALRMKEQPLVETNAKEIDNPLQNFSGK